MFKKLFKLNRYPTSLYTETLAGITTFSTAAYLLAVIPSMLAGVGFDKEAVFLAVCLGSGLITLFMGFFANLPVLMAPGLGITAYFTIVAKRVGNDAALVALFIASIIFLILTLSKTRRILFASIPNCLKYALMAGVGFFLMMIGCKLSNLITIHAHIGYDMLQTLQLNDGHIKLSSMSWDIALGDIAHPDVLLACIGLAIMAILLALQVKGAILIGLIVTTLIGIPLGVTNIHNIHFVLPNLAKLKIYFPNLNMLIKYIFDVGVLSAAFVFTFIVLMDNSTNLMLIVSKVRDHGTTDSAETTNKAMFMDACGTTTASLCGVPFFVYYLESLTGISAGGRTGFTALILTLFLILSLLLSPLFLIIPTAATAPALIIVGISVICGAINKINFDDFSEAFPSLLAMALMPFTYNIADSISGGVIFYLLLKIVQKKYKEIHWIMYLFALLILARYVFLR